MSLVTLYQVREFVGAGYSKPLGAKLRTWRQARRIARRLSHQGREIFLAPISVRKGKEVGAP